MADDAEAARPKAKETRTDEEDTEDNGSGKREESEKWALSEEQRAACKTMFEKLTLYLNGELTTTAEDYRLLQQLNQMTIAKYSDMIAMATRLNDSTKQLNEKYASLQPYLEQIDKIHDSVAALEQTAYRLDAYTKQLEEKLKSVEKR